MRQQVLKWQKNAQRIWSLPRERPHPELRNEPPLDSLEKPVPNPLVASLWIGSGAGWPLKGLGVAPQDHQVGAHFEAMDKGVLVAASKSIETFLAISTFPELRWPGLGFVFFRTKSESRF